MAVNTVWFSEGRQSPEHELMKLGIVYHMPCWQAADASLWELEGSFARYVDSLAPYFDEISLCVPVPTCLPREGTQIRATNVSLAPLPYFEGPRQFYPRLPLALPRLAQWTRRVDLLHCRVPSPAAPFAWALAHLAGRPTFLLVVGDLRALLPTVPYKGVKRWLWRAYTDFEERSLQWMVDHSLVFANGAALAAKHARPNRSVMETTTTTIREADILGRADTCHRSPVRLLVVSRIDPRKGLRVLPEVVRLLVGRGLEVRLDLIGPTVGHPGDVERDAILRQAVECGVETRIRLLGAIPLQRLLPMYQEHDVFVLPTLLGEGIPRVLLEAMASGLPVVTMRVAGIPSLIRHEINGLLVEEPTPSAIAEALCRVVTDAGLRQRLIAHGYETARALTLEAQAARMMEIVSGRLGMTLRQPATLPAV